MDHSVEKKPDLIQNNLSGGGLSDSAMGLLTGQEAAGQPVSLMSDKQLIDTLTTATESQQLITFGTKNNTEKGSGITPSHAYSISFDPKSTTVTLTNPIKPSSTNAAEPTKQDGSPLDGKSDGTLSLSLEQFKKYADHLYIGRSKSK